VWRVHVTRIGLTPLKGTRHVERQQLELSADGPVGDRVFCLVDPARKRVLRTVESRPLMRTVAWWADGELTTTLPAGTVTATPTGTGEPLVADYWGREASVEVVAGPWAEAYSRYLGYDVVLARAGAPGEVVYGGSVSLVTSSSLGRLSAEVGSAVDDAQFRATFTVDTGDLPAHVEDSWVGGPLRIGEAEVLVRGRLPRCAVVDLDPATGERAGDALRCLGRYRRALGEIVFGVDAVVTRPGRVTAGALVERG
jgi:uncharacterized protein YcbX